ncbi:MAG: TatD family hydrolase [Chitinophagaceae bacterium]
MNFIDTHTHLYDDRLDEKRQDEQIQRAFDAGVSKMYMPNCAQFTIAGMMRIAKDFPGKCMPMMGLHPTYVKADFQKEMDAVKQWLGKEKFTAVGEIGLDYYWDKTFIEQQKICFETQIEWAIEYGLPIVIHSRESTADCIASVRKKMSSSLRGVFHCFSGNLAEAEEIIEMGFLLGIGGVVTYKNAKDLQEAVKKVPLTSLVLETDAPYLAPMPFRGKKNESSFIPFIAEKIAALRGMSVEELAEATTANAQKLFPL